MSTESLSNLDSNLVIIVAWNFFHSWHSFIKDKHTDVKIVLLSCIFETVYARQLFFIFFLPMFVLAFFQVTQKYDQLVRGFEKIMKQIKTKDLWVKNMHEL